MPNRPHFLSQKGFTLVELAIVLVIIGLLIGAILVGQNMIRQAELRSIITDIDRYKAATYTFKDKYNCYPGDCATATNFFDVDSLGCPTGGGSTGTCNGTGNGILGPGVTNEDFRFWQQLAYAGLIAGNYTGVSGPGGAGTFDHIPGQNCPATKRANVGFSALSYGIVQTGALAWLWGGDYNSSFAVGLRVTGFETIGAAFSPIEMRNIDTKIDDGYPGMGFIMTRPGVGGHPNCNDGDTNQAATAQYLASETRACGFYVRKIF